jgi:hypothetical protein
MTKPFELGVSVITIVLSVFLSEFLIHRYIFEPGAPQPVTVTRVKPPGPTNIEWAAGSKTLILALQTSCHFCNESAPFYKRLMASAAGHDIRLVAVLPSEVNSSTDHLHKLGLSGLEVRSASLDSIHVRGTPTLIFVNDKGEVTDQWVGKLAADREDEVIQKITSAL